MFDARYYQTLRQRQSTPLAIYDKWLLVASIGLLLMGLMMVASCSIVISEKQFHQPFHYLLRQSMILGIGMLLALATLRLEMLWWERWSIPLLFFSLTLLILVLVPGVGHSVNGSMRWIGYGAFRVQPSEIAKFSIILYVASYVTRHTEEVKVKVQGFLKPLIVIAVFAVFLLREPDFGSVVVILLTALGVLFLAGVRIWQFAVLMISTGMMVAVIAVSSPYRMARLTSFLDPWSRQFDTGYQLTQSLIAFGRGGWVGRGLGGSIQKLFYLPEAHTDFLFAVLAEELGLLGCLLVIVLFGLLVYRALEIGRRALAGGSTFSAHVATGIGLMLGFQAAVNIGVNTGLLPTKGLTLPLMSYGGSSMLVDLVMIAMLLRIDYETRRKVLAFVPG